MSSRQARLAFAVLLAGCAAAPAGSTDVSAPAPADLPPAGYGTLRQDQFSIELREGAVQLKATPLEEEVLRLAAPDTYRRLSGLAEQQRRLLRERSPTGAAGGEPVLFLISFFSREEGARFNPSEVTIESGGRIFRPVQMAGLTPGWGEQRLRAQQPEMAVYAFQHGIDLAQPLILRYAGQASDQWREILPLLQEERLRAHARAAGRT